MITAFRTVPTRADCSARHASEPSVASYPGSTCATSTSCGTTAGQETRRWTLHGAWIKVLEYDDLEGGNTENSIEKLTICYQWWSQRRVWWIETEAWCPRDRPARHEHTSRDRYCAKFV